MSISLLLRERSTLARAIRRGTALLALLSVLTPVELLLPDAHDGDAVAGALDQRATTTPGADQHQNAPRPAPDHRAHVDHCAHAHLLIVGREQPLVPPVPPASQLFDTSSPSLESISTAPYQRPPIA